MEGAVVNIHPAPIFIREEVNVGNNQPLQQVQPSSQPFQSQHQSAIELSSPSENQPAEEEDTAPLCCPHCKKTFSNELSLRTHVGHHNRKGDKRLHGVTKIIKKRKIKFTFSKPRRPFDKLTCGICHLVFATSTSLIRHQIVHTGERPYQCDQCSKSYTTKWSLQVHQRASHSENPLTCQKCGENFSDEAVMRAHACSASIKTEISTIPEPVANVPSYQQTNPESTENRVFHLPSYHCRICNQSFSTPNALGGHMGSHRTGSQKTTSPTREKPTREKPQRELKSPARYSPPKTPRKLVYSAMSCTVCSKEFKYRLALKRHMVLHTDVLGPVQCPFCSEVGKDINSLIEHLDQHRKHTCPVCFENFDYPSSLQKHMESKHRVAKVAPFSCGICPEEFRDYLQLQTHMGSHKLENTELKSPSGPCENKGQSSTSYVSDSIHVSPSSLSATSPQSTMMLGGGSSAQILGEIKVEQLSKDPHPQLSKEDYNQSQNEPMDLSAKPDNTVQNVDAINTANDLTDVNGVDAANNVKDLQADTANDVKDSDSSIQLCTVCNAYFPKGPTYIKHQMWHLRFKKAPHVSCPICQRKFTEDFNMKRHLKKAHKQMSISFFKKPVSPVKQISPMNPVSSLQSMSQVKSEPLTPAPAILPKVPYRCKLCNKGYTWYSFLQTHMAREHNMAASPPASMVEEQKLFPCHLCSKAFTRKANLNLHLKTHDVDAPSDNTEEALVSAQEPWSIKQELPAQVQQPSEPVNSASESVASASSTFPSPPDHVEDKTDQETVHYCQVCGKIFTSSKSLGQHSRIHNRGAQLSKVIGKKHTEGLSNRFYCSVCNEGFFYYCRLKSHMAQAHGQHNSSMMRMPLGKKRHQCRYCNKVFLSAGAVGSHERTHRIVPREKQPATVSGPGPKAVMVDGKYPCGICGRKFDCPRGLGGHISIHNNHANHKPFKCNLCGQIFANRMGRDIHFKTQHSEEKWKEGRMSPEKFVRPKTVFEFRCEICQKVFASAQALGGHKRHHTELQKKKNDTNNNTFAHAEGGDSKKEVKQEVKEEVKEEVEIESDGESQLSAASYIDVTATDSYSDTESELNYESSSPHKGESQGEKRSLPVGAWDSFVKKDKQLKPSNLAGMPNRSVVFKLLSKESMKDSSQNKALAAIRQSVLNNRLIGESGFVLGSIHNPPADSPSGSDGQVLGYLIGHPNGFGPFCCPVCSRRFPVPSHFANHLIFHADQSLDVAYLSNVFRPASKSASPNDCSCNLFGLTFNDCPRCVQGFSNLDNLKRHVKQHVEKFIEYQVSKLNL